MESSTYPDKKVLEACQNWVNVACHSGTKHGTKDVVFGREKKTICATYGNANSDLTCAEHEAFNSASIPGREKVKGVPSIILLAPDGQKELHFSSGGMSGSELTKLMNETIKKNGLTPLPFAMYKGALDRRTEAEKALADGKHKDAIKLYQDIVKMKGETLKKWGEEGLGKVNEAGIALLKEASEKEGDEAKKLLTKIKNDFKPLECSKEAAKKLKELGEAKE